MSLQNAISATPHTVLNSGLCRKKMQGHERGCSFNKNGSWMRDFNNMDGMENLGLVLLDI